MSISKLIGLDKSLHMLLFELSNQTSRLAELIILLKCQYSFDS